MNYEKSQAIKGFKKLFLLSNGNIACFACHNDTTCIEVFDKNFKLVKDFTVIPNPCYLNFANISNNRFVFASFPFFYKFLI
jgi:hypothetical protein